MQYLYHGPFHVGAMVLYIHGDQGAQLCLEYDSRIEEKVKIYKIGSYN